MTLQFMYILNKMSKSYNYALSYNYYATEYIIITSSAHSVTCYAIN